MKLHDNQLKLIRLLILFNCLDYPSCLKVLDRENTGDAVVENDQYEKTYTNISYHVFYHIVMYREDQAILNMYPKIMALEGVTVHEFRTRENIGKDQRAVYERRRSRLCHAEEGVQ